MFLTMLAPGLTPAGREVAGLVKVKTQYFLSIFGICVFVPGIVSARHPLLQVAGCKLTTMAMVRNK